MPNQNSIGIAYTDQVINGGTIDNTVIGGTTKAALDVLMAPDGIQPLFDRAIAAATRRARARCSTRRRRRRRRGRPRSGGR
jgi:hypothetical protein